MPLPPRSPSLLPINNPNNSRNCYFGQLVRLSTAVAACPTCLRASLQHSVPHSTHFGGINIHCECATPPPPSSPKEKALDKVIKSNRSCLLINKRPAPKQGCHIKPKNFHKFQLGWTQNTKKKTEAKRGQGGEGGWQAKQIPATCCTRV